MKNYYVWNEEGELSCALFEEGNKPIHSQLVVKPYFIKPILENNIVIEGATPEEIAEANKPIVPETISRMNLEIQLLVLHGIEIPNIIEAIELLPDYMFSPIQKKIAIIKLKTANFFERYDADFNLVATLEGLSQENLNTIFINGNKL